MLPKVRSLVLALGLAMLVAIPAGAADHGLKQGTPDLKAAGALAFGPDGVLFVGDSAGAAVFAIDVADKKVGTGMPKVEKINEKIAALLGADVKTVTINDLAVNPATGNTYVSVSRGTGPDAKPVLIRVDIAGKVEEVSLKDVKFAKVGFANPVAAGNRRAEAITDVTFVDGKVIVAGLSNEEFASKLRVVQFPFKDADKGSSVEIYHGAHGKFETASPVRTFAVFDIDGKANLLAAYTCTPLVKFPLSDLKPGEKIKGTTIAELGNGNRPLDMFVYEKGGKKFVLIANNNRGMMKVSTDNIDKVESITNKITGTAGLKYETIASLKGVEQMDKFDKDNAIVLLRVEGALNLQTVPLP